MKVGVLSLSGGMDSSTLLLNLLDNDYQVIALSFDYGQKHRVELQMAESLVRYLKEKGKPVTHQIIDLSTLTPLLKSNLVDGGDEVPEGHYEADNMKATVVPNRNKIFSSIIQSVALGAVSEGASEVVIAMGIHAGDHSIYPDCRPEFRAADHKAFLLGNWDGEKVGFYTPYLNDDKAGILRDGEKCCESLSLDFKEVYSRTMTSYKPILIDGKWYSDYKSASSVERVEAFLNIGKTDPLPYADESGPVRWSVVSQRVLKTLAEASNVE